MRQRNKNRLAFLAAYRLTASITKAAKAASIERTLHYRWLNDPVYAAAFEAADKIATDGLHDEAIRRAYEGVFKPLVYQGQFTYPFEMREVVDEEGEVTRQRFDGNTPLGVQEYSDTLLMFMLKAKRPAVYRETFKGEISGPGGGPIPLETARLALLTDDELVSLLALARKLAPSLGA